MGENYESVSFDSRGVFQQHREELLSHPNTIRFEVVVPAILGPRPDVVDENGNTYTRCSPIVTEYAKEGTTAMTCAVLIRTLFDYIMKKLDDEDIKEAYVDLLLHSRASDFQDFNDLLGGNDIDTN